MQPHVVYVENATGLGVQTSEWIQCDSWCPGPVSVQVAVYNAPGVPVTYTVQSTLQDPNDPFSPVPIGSLTWVNTSDTAVVAATTTQQSNFLFAPKFARVVLTTTSTGSVSMTALQSSNGPI